MIRYEYPAVGCLLTLITFATFFRRLNTTISLKKLNAESPASVCRNNVTGVDLGQLMMETRKIPIKIAPRTRYIIRYSAKMLTTSVSDQSLR